MITSAEVLFDGLDDRWPGQPLLDLQECTLGTVCAAVSIGTGTDPQCVALSMPTPDPDRLQQAARVLRNEAVAVVLALLVAGEDLRTGFRRSPLQDDSGVRGEVYFQSVR